MAEQKFSNNASSKLAGALTNVATSLAVTATEGSEFPALAAGDWFMATLVKLVGGLPVVEIVRVTARTGDNMTIVRGQESTLATTFSAGDVIELRLTAGGLDNMAQQTGDNTYTAANDFTGGSISVPTAAPGTNNSGAASNAFVAALGATKAAAGSNSDITALNAVQTAKLVHSIPSLDWDENDQAGAAGRWRMVADGNTWKFLKNTAVARDFSTFVTPFEVDSSGNGKANGAIPVQQGTGVGQANNTVKLGWAAVGGSLKATVDVTDQGYFSFSSTNPATGSTTYGGSLVINNGTSNALTANGSAVINYGLTVAGQMTQCTGGSPIGPANLGGLFQVGSGGSNNIVMDAQLIQTRNNGVVKEMFLNYYGGAVNVGGNTSGNSSLVVDGQITSKDQILAQNGTHLKIALSENTTVRGYISADVNNCFATVNAANTLFTTTVDNSGNFVAAGNVTAFSDERLKENWRDLPEDFLDRLADINLLGIYDRIDTLQTELGMSAQQVQAFAPWLVHAHPDTGTLSLDYGRLGAVAAVRLAQVVHDQRSEIALLKEYMEHVMHKLGAA